MYDWRAADVWHAHSREYRPALHSVPDLCQDRQFGFRHLGRRHAEQRSAANCGQAVIPNVVVYEAELPKMVHEEADPRTGRSHHLRESLLTQSRCIGNTKTDFS
jgi:hypothetical protein